MTPNRQVVLAGLLLGLTIAAALALAEVLTTVFFAITIAYVLYPLRQWLVRRGVPHRVACAISTAVAFGAVIVLLVPIVYVLYRQRTELIESLGQIPEAISLTIVETEFVLETGPIIQTIETWLREVAILIAGAAPRLALELAVFALVVYGILYRPDAVRTAVFGLVPDEYHDVVARLHERTRSTLFAIYVLQATTAVATFAIALLVFRLLGYQAPFSLAVIAGVLQFVPIVGPSVLVVVLAISDAMIGVTTRAVSVLVVGLIFVAFVPDAVIRTQLADRVGYLSPTLYFVGFVGGILTLGMIGLIAGPLVVALLVEVVGILSERSAPEQQQL